jgi:Zn-dependent M16 (insulinase) family peptidase
MSQPLSDCPSYLSVFQNALFSLPIQRASGATLTHEEVVDQLDRDTVSYDTSLGFGSSFTEMARVSIKVETAQYSKAIAWIWDLLHGSIFDPERWVVLVAIVLNLLFLGSR